MDIHFDDLVFEAGAWNTPDGKIVPFDQADITELLRGESYDRFRDDSDVEITITRWPRKVVIACIVTEGIDGYTGGGDGDGVIFEPIFSTKYVLHTTDRATFSRDFDKIMSLVDDKLFEMRDLLE